MPVIDGGGGPRPTVSIGTSESAASSEPWLPPPGMVASREVDELPAGRGRDEHLAGVRVRERGGCAHATVGHLVEQRLVLVAVPARHDLRPSSRKSTIPAAGWASSRSATARGSAV